MPTWAWIIIVFVAFSLGVLIAALCASREKEELRSMVRWLKREPQGQGRVT